MKSEQLNLKKKVKKKQKTYCLVACVLACKNKKTIKSITMTRKEIWKRVCSGRELEIKYYYPLQMDFNTRYTAAWTYSLICFFQNVLIEFFVLKCTRAYKGIDLFQCETLYDIFNWIYMEKQIFNITLFTLQIEIHCIHL